jgi:hypothetical protein
MARRPRVEAENFGELEDETTEPVIDTGDLDDLDDPEFGDISWNVYRMRTTEDMAKAGSNAKLRVWLTKKLGPISLEEIRSEFGGGAFEFWGKRNGSLVKKERRDIEGEPMIRKAIGVASLPGHPNGTVSSAPAAQSVDEAVARAVREAVGRERKRAEREAERREREDERRRMDEKFARLEQLIAQVQASPRETPARGEKIADLVGALVSLKTLMPEAPGLGDPATVIGLVRDIFTQGRLSVGETEATNSESTAQLEMVKTIAEVVGRLFAQRATARPPRAHEPQPQPAPGPNAHGSVAEVVQAPASPSAGQPESLLHRWKGAVELVARNMVRGRGAEDTAATIEDLLNEEELRNLKGAQQADGMWHPTAKEALDWLEAQGLGPFPQLQSPGGLVYLDSVLAELRLEVAAETE